MVNHNSIYRLFIFSIERVITMPKIGDIVDMTSDNAKDIMKNFAKQEEIFLNSECVFVEYYDILKCPWYILLSVLHQNDKIRPVVDLSAVEYLDTNELFEWYCNRKNRNFLFDLASAPTDKMDYDALLAALMENQVFYQVDTLLNVVEPLKICLRQKMIKKMVVYTEEDNPYVREDIVNIFGQKSNIHYYHGDFAKVLERIPTDTTYFLSDFNKIVTMAECKRLNLASLVLPYDFEYNFSYNEKDEKIPIVDMDYLGKDFIFKLNYYNSCYV